MTPEAPGGARQRRELTFKHNLGLGRHGWLRLTPAYSVKVVEQILAEEYAAERVFDPFSGTGTTALAAANRGIPALALDINPFLVWLGKLKSRSFSPRELLSARNALSECLGAIARAELAAPPKIHDIERWWHPGRLRFLQRLRASIQVSSELGSAANELLTVAFCRTLIGLSNASFNHQSMSFGVSKHETRTPLQLEGGEEDTWIAAFRKDAEFVLEGAGQNPLAEARISLGDARTLRGIGRGSFDVLLTSPPYPNRMSYVRELRPYMYWTGFLNEARQAGELDWQAIGGTWGVATSRLSEWQAPTTDALPKSLVRAIAQIEQSEKPNARLLARYVAKYFHDMAQHIGAVRECVAPGGRVHYIVGNSTFYGVLISAEAILAELLAERGFQGIGVRRLRKRNSKKELFEFDVVATRRVDS